MAFNGTKGANGMKLFKGVLSLTLGSVALVAFGCGGNCTVVLSCTLDSLRHEGQESAWIVHQDRVQCIWLHPGLQ